VLQGVLPLATVWLMKLIVDGITDGITGPDRGATFRDVAILIILAAAVGLAGVVLRSLATIDEALSRTVTDHVTDLVHDKATIGGTRHLRSGRPPLQARRRPAVYRQSSDASSDASSARSASASSGWWSWRASRSLS
jgi:hypothetical protein